MWCEISHLSSAFRDMPIAAPIITLMRLIPAPAKSSHILRVVSFEEYEIPELGSGDHGADHSADNENKTDETHDYIDSFLTIQAKDLLYVRARLTPSA